MDFFIDKILGPIVFLTFFGGCAYMCGKDLKEEFSGNKKKRGGLPYEAGYVCSRTGVVYIKSDMSSANSSYTVLLNKDGKPETCL